MHRWIALLSFAACVCFGGMARAQNTLNPARYTSPSGRYTIECRPSDSEGIGASEVTCKLDGVQVWRSKLSFAFWDAAVTDSGLIAGYSYQWGRQGYASASVGSDESLLWVVVLDEQGRVRAKDARERKHPGVMSNPPSPYEPLAKGLTLIPEEDLVIVRVEGGWNRETAPWWLYRLSTGERVGDVAPDQPAPREYGFHKEIFAEVVPGTPLVFVHWCVYSWQDGEQSVSAALYLLNGKGEAVWSLDIPGEYDGLGDRWSWYYDLVEPGIAQAEVGPRSFSFCSYAEGERVRYSCEPDGAGAWSVSEASREPCTPGPAETAAPEPAPFTPELLGRVLLESEAGEAPPFSSVNAFAVGAGGSSAVCTFAEGDPAPNKLVVLDNHGATLRERSLGDIRGPVEVAPYSDGVWLVYATGLGEAGAGVWLYREADDSLSALPDFAEGGLRTATALGDGGFVGLAGPDWLDAQDLVCFDNRGAVRWRADLFSPQDVTVTTDGIIVALEGIRDQLRYFSVRGEELHTLSLATALGGVNYPSDLHADTDGGVILHDFNGHPPIHRIDPGGKGWAAFTPRYPDGREFRLYGAVQRGPDGSLWTSDGRSVLRLDAEGVVTQIIGEAPDAAPLRRIRALTVGPDGRFYCINEYNGAVHVFERDGTAAEVLRPQPDDFTIDAGLGSITVASDGSVFVLPTTHSIGANRGYLVFDGEGTRVGFDRFKLGEVREEWLCIPGTSDRWLLGYTSIGRVNAEGKPALRIRKRANGDWLGNVQAAAVGADGTFAVVASPREMGARGPAELSVYTPDGEPLRAFPMDGQSIFARVAVSMPYVVTTDGDSLYLYDTRADDPPRRAALPDAGPGDDRGWWYVFADPEEPAVWVTAAGSRELLLYRLPAD